jgi:hypothetical protein
VRGPVRGAPGVIETDISTKLAAQLEAMQKSIDRLTNQNISAVHQSPTCAICGGGDHLAINYNWGGSAEGDAEQVNVLNNNYRPQNNPSPILITLDGEITQISPEETTKITNPKTRTKGPIRIDRIRDTGRGNLTKAPCRNLIWNK